MRTEVHTAPGALDGTPTLPETAWSSRPHLLDASMSWRAGDALPRVIAAKRARFAALGWQHTLMAPIDDGPGELDCGGLHIPRSGGRRLVLDRARAAARIAARQPDIIEAADASLLGWAVLDAAAKLDVPAVTFCHGEMLQHARPWLHWPARRMRDYCLRLYERYDLVLAPSRTLARQLHEWGLPQALHQPFGVDCDLFKPAARDGAWRQRLLRQLELAPDTKLILCRGRIDGRRGAMLAEAVARLGPRHALLAVGGARMPQGAHVRRLDAEFDERRLARLVASCDAYVDVNLRHGSDLAALEAMACGTPIVVHPAGGLGELADSAGHMPSGDQPRDWAEALEAALAGPAAALTWFALQRARLLDWSRVLDLLARRYMQLMRARQTPISLRAGWAP